MANQLQSESMKQSGGEGRCKWSATEVLHMQRERHGAAGTRRASPVGGSASASVVAEEVQQPLQLNGVQAVGQCGRAGCDVHQQVCWQPLGQPAHQQCDMARAAG